MDQEFRFDQRVERLLPEVEKKVIDRDPSVVAVAEGFKAQGRSRLHLKISLGDCGRGRTCIAYALSPLYVEREDVDAMVSNILWAVHRLDGTI